MAQNNRNKLSELMQKYILKSTDNWTSLFYAMILFLNRHNFGTKQFSQTASYQIRFSAIVLQLSYWNSPDQNSKTLGSLQSHIRKRKRSNKTVWWSLHAGQERTGLAFPMFNGAKGIRVVSPVGRFAGSFCPESFWIRGESIRAYEVRRFARESFRPWVVLPQIYFSKGGTNGMDG